MFSLLDALATDVRHALRRSARAPGVSAIVVVTLSLAIAANTTILSLLKPTVLRRLAVPNPEALVAISATDSRTGVYSAIHVQVLRALQDDQRSFATLGAYVSGVVRVEFGGYSTDLGVEGVTADYFAVLDVRAKAGRLLSAVDDPMAPVGVMSERLAARLFGDGNAVGQSIMVDGRQVEIVGVTAGFAGVRMDGGDDLFLPLAYLRFIQGGDPKVVVRAQQIVGRLARGVTIDQARGEVLGRWPSIQAGVSAELPAALRPAIDSQRVAVDSFARGFSGLRDRYGRSLLLVMGLALALLGVAIVNLTGLMLARCLARHHEFAVRVALGVGRARLFQQTVIDGVMLSFASLVIALPLSWWMSQVLTSMVSVSRAIPLGQTTPDLQVLAIVSAVTLLTGLAIGLLPARHAMSRKMDDTLRGRGTAQRIRGSARAVLITQVALSMILVVGAGLFVTTLANLYANDLQQRPNSILFTRLARNPLGRNAMLSQAYLQNLQEQLGKIQGADRAAFSASYPAYLAFFDPVPTDTVSLGGEVQAAAVSDQVTPGFFQLFAIAQLRGRDFAWSDSETAPPVAIVNETLARQLSESGEIVGRHARIKSGQSTIDVEIVGVVADANVTSIRERHEAAYYRPLMQELRRAQFPMTHVRVTGDVAAAQRAYVDVVNAQGQHFVRAIFTMDDWVDNAVVEQRLIAGMASFAATLTMTLSCVGLFGLLAYSVSSRIREIGVRMSVGATASEIVRMIVREGVTVVIPGVAIGIPLAIGATWAIRSQLYGVSATDPWTIGSASAMFIATATFAAWLPARRASRIQPTEALRQE